MFSVEENENKSNKKIIYIIISIVLVIVLVIGLFTYLNQHKYDKIKKHLNKDLVYTRYKRNIHGNKTEVPMININSTYVDEINKEIADTMNKFLIEDYNVNNYKYSINKNILSVVLIMINNNTETTPEYSFKTYNINLNTLKKISNKKILNIYNTNEIKINSSIKKQFIKYYKEEVKEGYFEKRECNYKCFINQRNIKNYIDKVEYYIDNNKLYAYKQFNPYSIYEEEEYYDLDKFMFYISN